jgi:hypothetical protein
MGRFRYSNLPAPEHPSVRARVEHSRKRFHCDLLEFWRQCKPRCRQGQRCLGDPYHCLSRHHAAMPRDHAAWSHAHILSRTGGIWTAERTLRALGLSLADVRRDAGPSRPQQTDGALPTIDSAQEGARAHSEADIPSQSLSEALAELKKAVDVILTSKHEPERASLAPSPRADAEALVVIPKSESRAAVEAFNERAGKGMDYNDLMARLRKLGAPVGRRRSDAATATRARQ